eukprot:Gb_26963 [translate_table: standard]
MFLLLEEVKISPFWSYIYHAYEWGRKSGAIATVANYGCNPAKEGMLLLGSGCRNSKGLSGHIRVLPVKPIKFGVGTVNYSMSATLLQEHEVSSGPKYVKPDHVGSPKGLVGWLSTRMSTHFTLWGIEPGTKNVTNLWMELVEGEISLEDSCPPKRTVNVASVNIRNGFGQILVESHQEMGDGSIRVRNRPLSEKMKAGETVEEACLRGIYEELGPVLGARDKINLLLNTYEKQVEERSSLSYPGLLTCYVVHSVDAVMKHLPNTDFFTDEDEDGRMNGAHMSSSSGSESREKAIGVKKHFWKWITDPAVQRET